MPLFRLARPSLRLRQPALVRTFLASQPRFSEQQPSVVSSLQADLKAALRAKDKPRLSVLRAVLAEITNASKTDKPVSSDKSLLNLLSKQIKASQAAMDEFDKAKRGDLVEKEQVQLAILEEYAGKIPKVGEEELEGLISQAVEELGSGAKLGPLMSNIMGKLSQRPVDMDVVKTKVEQAIKA